MEENIQPISAESESWYDWMNLEIDNNKSNVLVDCRRQNECRDGVVEEEGLDEVMK